MSDPLQPSMWHRSRAYIGILALIGLIAAIGMFVFDLAEAGEQPIVHEQMSVIGFGMGSGYTGAQPIMRVLDESGQEFSVPAPTDIGDFCAIGDKVAIIRQGLNLRVGLEACDVSPTS